MRPDRRGRSDQRGFACSHRAAASSIENRARVDSTLAGDLSAIGDFVSAMYQGGWARLLCVGRVALSEPVGPRALQQTPTIRSIA